MEKNKLLSLLATFDSTDWRQFGLYIRSPFFNQTESLVRFFEVLEELFQKETVKENTLKKPLLFAKAFPDIPYEDAEFNRLSSRLLGHASDYLTYRAWRDDGIAAPCYTLQVYQDRKLDKHFKFTYAKTQEALQAEKYRNIHFYQQQYRLSEIAESHFATGKGRESGAYIQQAADCFDHYMIAQKLQHLCNAASFNSIHPQAITVNHGDIVVNLADSFRQIPIVSIYHSLFLMLTDKDAALHFATLRSMAARHEALLSQKELNFVYLTLINFCIGRIRYGEKAYATPLLELYEQALDKGFLMDKGLISPWTFKNVVKLGLGLQRYDWVEGFIRQYSPLLAEQEKTEALHFNLADLHYHRQDYEKAQLHLREVEFSDIRYYLHGRILLAKIYYTIQAWEALDSLLSSFKVYLLRSKKMNREEKKPYLNFIRILDKLVRKLPEKQPKLRETISQTPMLTARTWLLEVCDE